MKKGRVASASRPLLRIHIDFGVHRMRAPPAAAASLPLRMVVFWTVFAALLAVGIVLFFRTPGRVAPMLEVLSDR